MSLKAKLVTTIAALCMVLCLLVGGVWAASQVTVNMSGTVSFKADDVYAKVTASVTSGAKETAEATKHEVIFNDGTALGGEIEEVTGGEKTWDDFQLNFADKDEAIVITVTVENLGERALKITYKDNTVDAAKNNITVTIAETTSTNGSLTKVGAESAVTTATYTVSIKLIDTNKSVDKVPFNVAFTLEDENHPKA